MGLSLVKLQVWSKLCRLYLGTKLCVPPKYESRNVFNADENGFVSLHFNHVLPITDQIELNSEINSDSLHLIFDGYLIETWKSFLEILFQFMKVLVALNQMKLLCVADSCCLVTLPWEIKRRCKLYNRSFLALILYIFDKVGNDSPFELFAFFIDKFYLTHTPSAGLMLMI